MRTTVLLPIFFLFCASCANKRDHNGHSPLVELGESVLYKENLQAVLPVGLSKEDSLLFAQHYIRNWVEEELLYQKAESNIPDDAEIQTLVDNYRKALIMHAYQQKLIGQRLSDDLEDEQIVDYYEQNKELFKLDRALIKGLFIKVPLTAPRLNNVRKWYKTNTHEAIDALEKYSLQSAVKYEYFYDKWIPVAEVLDMIPLKVDSPEEYINKNRRIELKDATFYYFLNISDYRSSGEQEPYEFAKPKAKEMLTNMKRADFMKQVKDDLYQQAVDKEKIIYKY